MENGGTDVGDVERLPDGFDNGAYDADYIINNVPAKKENINVDGERLVL